jgi:hypothetical protein
MPDVWAFQPFNLSSRFLQLPYLISIPKPAGLGSALVFRKSG